MTNVAATPTIVAALGAPSLAPNLAFIEANPALAALNTGSLITATVVGRNPQGLFMLETEYGLILLSARLNLPVGSSVVLEVQSAGARLAAVVLSVDGQPAAGGERTPVPALPSAAENAAAPAPVDAEPVAQVSLLAGTVVTATVVRAAGEGTAAAPPAQSPVSNAGSAAVAASRVAALPYAGPPLDVGSQFPVRIVAIEPPQPATENATVSTPLEAAPPRAPAASSAPTAPSTAPITEPVSAQQSTGLPEIPPRLPASERIVPGFVLGASGGGLVEVKTPAGLIELPMSTPPPQGSFILLEPLARPQLPSQTEPLPPSVATETLAHEWPALSAALATLQEDGRGAEMLPLPAASAEAAPATAHAGPRLALELLTFAAALDSSDPALWLTPAVLTALDKHGQARLTGQLGEDFTRLGQLAAETGPGDWRSFFIPVLDGRTLSQLRLFLRRREREPEGAKRPPGGEPAGRRFVIELDLSRLGPIQLDGFLKERRLNLVLRSRLPVSDPLRTSLAESFGEAVAAVGLTGALAFQDKLAHFPVAPLEGVRAKAQAVVV
jgi:hypothetical protein